MGLTVYYKLRSFVPTAREALAKVKQLRQAALDLPFDRVGPIMEYNSRTERFSELSEAMQMKLELCAATVKKLEVLPDRLFSFFVYPAQGSETAEFGLCHYPRNTGFGNHPTKLKGWWWQEFCKTQYASNPKYGGYENFRRCHLSLVTLLDIAKKLGLRPKVSDESHFYEHRDESKLREEIESWNQLIAGFFGKLKDSTDMNIVAPIANFPNFEHLEAKDQKRKRK